LAGLGAVLPVLRHSPSSAAAFSRCLSMNHGSLRRAGENTSRTAPEPGSRAGRSGSSAGGDQHARRQCQRAPNQQRAAQSREFLRRHAVPPRYSPSARVGVNSLSRDTRRMC
jgi:hypothetical protein